MKRKLTITAIVIALVATALTMWWWQQPDWPEFNSTNASEPQVIVRVDRDYNYHIADLITVELFVKESQDSIVDLKTVTVGGDFELNSKPEFAQRKGTDGTLIHRIVLRVQTFQPNPEGVLKTGLGYKQGEKRLNLTVPDQSLYWSNTYDGRKEMQQGDDSRIPAWQYLARFALSLAFASVIFATLCIVAVRNYVRNRPGPFIDHKRMRAEDLVSTIEAGKGSQAVYLELDGIIRDHFKIGPIPASQLDTSILNANLHRFLTLIAPAIYGQDQLSPEDSAELALSSRAVLVLWK